MLEIVSQKAAGRESQTGERLGRDVSQQYTQPQHQLKNVCASYDDGAEVQQNHNSEQEILLCQAVYLLFAEFLACDVVSFHELLKSKDGSRNIRQFSTLYKLLICAKESAKRKHILDSYSSQTPETLLHILQLTSPVKSEASRMGKIVHLCLKETIVKQK